ncbi:hypothetical protein MTO96_042745 [Rhipicephalus appendiculatus]
MPGLREQRQRFTYCDIFLQASDGTEVCAHKFVISASYWWALPIYHSPAEELVHALNVEQVMQLNLRLQIGELREMCAHVLKTLINSSPVKAFKTARLYGYADVAAEAFAHLCAHFDEVAQSTELQLLSLQELYTILDSDQLKVRSEVEVLSAMLNWADGDAARTEALPTLVPLLRLAFTSMPALDKILRQVHANENCLSAIRFLCEDILGRTATLPSEVPPGVDLILRPWSRPRLPSDVIFHFGKESGRTVLVTFNPEDAELEGPWGREVQLASSIYVVGGFNTSGPLRSAERYDVHTDMWVRIASMRDHRMGASAAAACGRIIV